MPGPALPVVPCLLLWARGRHSQALRFSAPWRWVRHLSVLDGNLLGCPLTVVRRGASVVDADNDSSKRLAGHEVAHCLWRLAQGEGPVDHHAQLAGLHEARKGAHQLPLVW